MSENTKTYLLMFIMCLIVAVYLKYGHQPLISAAVKAVG